jgi:hypothetical protein
MAMELNGKKKTRIVVRRRRMIHIHDPSFHTRDTKLSGIMLFTNSPLPISDPSKQYFINVTKMFLDSRAERIPFFPHVAENDLEDFVSTTFGISSDMILFTKRMYSTTNLDIYFVEVNFSAKPKLDGFISNNIIDLYSDKTVESKDLYTNIIKQKKPNTTGINGHLRKKLGGRVVGGKAGGDGLPITIKNEAIYRQMIGAFEISV